MCPTYTDAANRAEAEIAAGAGQIPTSPEAVAAPAPAANPGFRQAMLDALPNIAAAQGIPAERRPAWDAEQRANIDADADYVAPDPAVAAEAARAEAHAISINATADQYQVEWPATFMEGAKDLASTTAEMRQFAADLKLPAGMGKTLLEHLASIAPKFRAMDETAASAYKLQAENDLRSMFGSQEAVDAKLAEAKAALLAIAKDNKLAAALSGSLQMLDGTVLVLLSGHAQRHAAYTGAGKK